MRPDSIHRDDDMFHGSVEHYDSVGKQLASFAQQAAEFAAAPNAKILELPCGYGRVTRNLVVHFDPSQIVVADIMTPAVDYCVSMFGVVGTYVEEPVYEFRNIQSESFDVAILGSLITHLSQVNARCVMQYFMSKLRRNGVAVVTTHGERSRELLGRGDCYQVGESARANLLSDYDAGQYGFVNYLASHSLETKTVDYVGDSYGIALIPTDWVRAVCRDNGFTIIEHRAGAWDAHQDVFFIQR
jgi:SAM-dependent methyltransferase